MAKMTRPSSTRLKKPAKIALVTSQYNRDITEKLEKTCLKELKKAGAAVIATAHTPGAFELPYKCQQIIRKIKPDAVIALGCIIKGETPHYDYIAKAVALGIMEVGLRQNVPVVFGVLTCNTKAQAKARIAKGVEAAQTAIQLINTK
ncbi:MAG: 6,7-dimethyl-8-ribityllumazine synthase [Candidatus Peregrinibacteria bacterium]